MEIRKCEVCGGEEFKKGKLHGISSLQPLKSRTSIGGSELIFTFCSECGAVAGIKVADPDRIDSAEEKG